MCVRLPQKPSNNLGHTGLFSIPLSSTDSFAISPEDFVEAPTKKPIKRIPEAESNDIIVTEVGLGTNRVFKRSLFS